MLTKISSFFFDVAKIALIALVIGALTKEDYDVERTAALGAAVMLVALAAGLITTHFDNRNKKN